MSAYTRLIADCVTGLLNVPVLILFKGIAWNRKKRRRLEQSTGLLTRLVVLINRKPIAVLSIRGAGNRW